MAPFKAAFRCITASLRVPAVAASLLVAVAAHAANPPLTGVTALEAGSGHVCALRNDGSVYCWGSGGLGRRTAGRAAAPVEQLRMPAVAVAAGGSRTCSITAGEASCWAGYSPEYPARVEGQPAGVARVDAAPSHACLVTTGGAAYCWGENYDGQLGDGSLQPQYTPVPVIGLSSGVTSLSLGDRFSCAVVGAGVRCWGYNGSGQLGDGTHAVRAQPVTVSGLSTGAARVAAGWRHACALTAAGGVKCWGANDGGQLGDGTFAERTVPVNVLSLSAGVVDLAAGHRHTCALRNDGVVLCWGANGRGELGDGTFDTRVVPAAVVGLAGPAVDIAAGDGFTCAVISNGTVQCFGDNFFGSLGSNYVAMRPMPIDVLPPAATTLDVDAGESHSCAVNAAGAAVCWGVNDAGQIGDGTQSGRTSPVAVQGLGGGVVQARAASSHSCALTAAGAAFCWGANAAGQLGDSTFELRTSPVPVTGLGAGVTRLAVGWNHSCAVASGGVKCWGSNYGGQLGHPTPIASNVPVDVTGLASGVVDVAAASAFSCALRSNGGIKCWGSAWLGTGTPGNSAVPVDVLGLNSGATGLSLGVAHGCAIAAGGAARCWGFNSSGSLGDGTTQTRHAPVQVQGLASGVTRISAGSSHTCAVTAGGIVRCWGSNAYGQLGPLASYEAHAPVEVPLPEPAVDVTAGTHHSCARLASGATKCWGRSTYLGTNESSQSSHPLQVVVADFTTTATLSSTPTSSNVGDLVTLVVRLVGRDTIPTGGVRFTDGGRDLSCSAFIELGMATCDVFPSQGVHRFEVHYGGDASNLPITATLVHVVNAVAGDHCAGFDDVDATHPLCRHVDWVRNRNITLGCSAFAFCADATVSRLAMAAFMNRSGRALSPEVVSIRQFGFFANPEARGCSVSMTFADHPRRASVDAVVSIEFPSDGEAAVEVLGGRNDFDLRTIGPRHLLFGAAGRATSLKVGTVLDIPAGEPAALALRLTRLDGGSTFAFLDGSCTLRATVFNRDETFVPYDAGE